MSDSLPTLEEFLARIPTLEELRRRLAANLEEGKLLRKLIRIAEQRERVEEASR